MWSVTLQHHWVPVEGLFSMCDAVSEYYQPIYVSRFYLEGGVEWELLLGQIVGYMLDVATVGLVCHHFYFIQQCSKCLTV